jgi:hypothetical protein
LDILGQGDVDGARAVIYAGIHRSEGMLFVSAAVDTVHPHAHQFNERDVVAFQVIDSLEGDSARGDVVGEWGGAVRPLLTWSTQFCPGEHKAAPLGEAQVRRHWQT